MKSWAPLILAFFCSIAASAALSNSYRVELLPTPAGEQTCAVQSLNDKNQAIIACLNKHEAYQTDLVSLWTPQDGAKPIGQELGLVLNITLRLNNRGEIAGTSLRVDSSGTQVTYSFRPFIWNAQDGYRALSDFSSDLAYWVSGFNDDGTIVGTAYRNGVPHGFVWNARDGFQVEDTFIESSFEAVNENGQFVGTAKISGLSHIETVTGNSITSMTRVDPHTLYGLAINKSGEIAGSCISEDQQYETPCYLQNGAVHYLMPETAGDVLDINDSGEMTISDDAETRVCDNDIQFSEFLSRRGNGFLEITVSGDVASNRQSLRVFRAELFG